MIRNESASVVERCCPAPHTHQVLDQYVVHYFVNDLSKLVVECPKACRMRQPFLERSKFPKSEIFLVCLCR